MWGPAHNQMVWEGGVNICYCCGNPSREVPLTVGTCPMPSLLHLLPLSPWLILLQTQVSRCSSYTPRTVLPPGLCTCCSPANPAWKSSPLFSSLLKSHLLRGFPCTSCSKLHPAVPPQFSFLLDAFPALVFSLTLSTL